MVVLAVMCRAWVSVMGHKYKVLLVRTSQVFESDALSLCSCLLLCCPFKLSMVKEGGESAARYLLVSVFEA